MESNVQPFPQLTIVDTDPLFCTVVHSHLPEVQLSSCPLQEVLGNGGVDLLILPGNPFGLNFFFPIPEISKNICEWIR